MPAVCGTYQLVYSQLLAVLLPALEDGGGNSLCQRLAYPSNFFNVSSAYRLPMTISARSLLMTVMSSGLAPGVIRRFIMSS